jgi:hypothetical protein
MSCAHKDSEGKCELDSRDCLLYPALEKQCENNPENEGGDMYDMIIDFSIMLREGL